MDWERDEEIDRLLSNNHHAQAAALQRMIRNGYFGDYIGINCLCLKPTIINWMIYVKE